MAVEGSDLLVVRPGEGKSVERGGLGVDFKIWGAATAGALSIVEHPMQPHRLVPPHVHESEDELSYVLEGTFGVRIGDVEAEAGPGTYVYKPKGGAPQLLEPYRPTGAPDRADLSGGLRTLLRDPRTDQRRAGRPR